MPNALLLLLLVIDSFLCLRFSLFIICLHPRECLGEAHEPCDCQTWRNWLQKVKEMKPEECMSDVPLSSSCSSVHCIKCILEPISSCTCVVGSFRENVSLCGVPQWQVLVRLTKMQLTACGC